MMKNILIACSLLLLLPMAWADASQVRAEKAQRQAARREALKEVKPVPELPQRDMQAQRRADLRAALVAKRPVEQQGEDNKHLTPRERMELRQQLRQQQAQRQQGKG